jgi:hypothetical protein
MDYLEEFVIMKKSLIASAVLAALGGISSANAALTNDGLTTLSITLGDGSCASTGTWPDCDYGANVVTSGSFFTMDGNYGAIIESDLGVVLGTTQAFSGTAGAPLAPYPGDGTNITQAWTFFGNLGTNYTVSAADAISDTSIDFSGWRVGWGEVAEINMGSGGTATISCGTCDDGAAYSLDYSAVVPPGDPSGFGGVAYGLHMEGFVSQVPVPAAVWLFGSGLMGLVGVARRRKKAA